MRDSDWAMTISWGEIPEDRASLPGKTSQNRPNNAKQNHPGCPPNQAFAAVLRITNSFPLKQALSLVEIKTLDHFIVAGSKTISFAERGLI
jgi:RadC-like JAB domain-containing protein